MLTQYGQDAPKHTELCINLTNSNMTKEINKTRTTNPGQVRRKNRTSAGSHAIGDVPARLLKAVDGADNCVVNGPVFYALWKGARQF